MRADIVEGATLPDYELPDHTDTPRSLSLLQGNDPMILTLNRGVYCPKDRQQLIQLVEFNKQLAVGFVRLVTITTDNLILGDGKDSRQTGHIEFYQCRRHGLRRRAEVA
jgi:peroxiredoxin